MRRTFLLLMLGIVLSLGAAGIKVDGKLDEQEWLSAKPYAGFTYLKAEKRNNDYAKTEFRTVVRDGVVYFGIKCHEPLIESLKEKQHEGVWSTDGVEIFLAPDGGVSEYYQFLITYKNYRYAMYYAEGGNIKPDPFGPLWDSAIYSGPDFWSAEVKLPLEVFYMTRQELWKKEWRVNVARSRLCSRPPELTTWSPLERQFPEPHNFKLLGGFPMRPAADDVYISSAAANVRELKGGRPAGELVVEIQLASAGKYEFSGKTFSLKAGTNTVKTDFEFEKDGRNNVLISFKRLSDGKEFSRYYPVIASFMPIKVNFTLPEYRRNFYPGQDFSKVCGSVVRSGKEPVTLVLSGAGLAEQKLVLNGDKLDFSFDTSAMQYGEAFLKVTCGKYEKTEKIRRLEPKPEGFQMSWISGGNLVVNGKPVLRRNMYATYYMGGEAFKEKFDGDNLYLTEGIGGIGTVEPFRLVKGIEGKEAKKDVKPCKEYFDALDKTIARGLEGKGVFYYISDEPECRNLSPVYLRHIYEYLCEKDPYHVVLVGSRASGRYVDCADWFETHPYILAREENGERKYDRPISSFGSYIEQISGLNRPDKCIGSMLTSYAPRSRYMYSRYPDFGEMVCHTWAFIIHGCKTFQPYAYHDLGDMPSVYEGIRYVFSSMNALEDIILHGKRTLLFSNKEAGAAVFELKNGEKMVVAVNYSLHPVKVTLDGVKGHYFEFRGDRVFDSFKDIELKRHEVIVATTVKKGTGLKSQADAAAEIDRLEKKRRSTGNLLFERHGDVEVAASSPTPRLPYKMFDGTRDVLAFTDRWGKNKFYEISFPKPDFIPTFSRVRIYGHNLGTPVFMIRKRGKWLTPEPKKTSTEKYMIEYDFGEDLRTVKLRIEFQKSKLELYEIELHK